LYNVAFLRTQIDQVNEYFSKDEVDEIWITFPDPQLRKSKAKKRLIHPKFLRLYKQFLTPGGYIHLKTDSPDLYHFTRTVIKMYGCSLNKDYPDLYDRENTSRELQIKTHYESLDIAQTNHIHYLCFSLPQQIPGKENEEKLKEWKSVGINRLSIGIQSFFDEGTWDETRVITNTALTIQNGLPAPVIPDALKTDEQDLLGDTISFFRPNTKNNT